MSAREVVSLLKKFGFKKIDQTGSHVKFRNKAGITVIIPKHKGRDIGRGLLRKIFKQAGIEYEDV